MPARAGDPVRRTSHRVPAEPAPEIDQRDGGGDAQRDDALLRIVEQLGQAGPAEQLDTDEPGAPHQLDGDERPQRPTVEDDAQAGAHGATHVAGPHRPPFVEQHGQGTEVDGTQHERGEDRQHERLDPADRPEGHQPSRTQRTGRDGDPDRRAGRGDAVFDVRPAVLGQALVDVPGLERTGVEGPEDALQRPRSDKGGEAVRGGEPGQRDDVERAGQEEHLAPADRVGQPACRQLEHQHDPALHRHGEPDLGQRQPPRLHEHRRDRDQEPRRQPAQRGEDEEAADERHAGNADSSRITGSLSPRGVLSRRVRTMSCISVSSSWSSEGESWSR